jgi:hypothetical protein
VSPSFDLLQAMLRDFPEPENRSMFKQAFPNGKARSDGNSGVSP